MGDPAELFESIMRYEEVSGNRLTQVFKMETEKYLEHEGQTHMLSSEE